MARTGRDESAPDTTVAQERPPRIRRRTYRTFDEQRGQLSPAEERFERWRRTVGLFAGPATALLVLLLPLDLDRGQHNLAAIRG
jgi:hypothetical protein